MKTSPKKFTALICLVFTVNCVFAYQPELNIWKERQPQLPHPKTAPAGRLPIHLQERPAVTLIQDVHGNEEAQKDIARLVGRALRKNPKTLLALEGLSGSLNPDSLRRGAHPDALRQVADYLLREDEISGPVYYALLEKRSLFLAGVEDASLYDSNVVAAVDSFRPREKIKHELRNETQTLSSLKRNELNPELFRFDQMVESYREGKMDLSAFLPAAQEKALAARLSSSPTIKNFLRALELEKGLDFFAAEEERKRLLSLLSSRLKPAEMKTLLRHAEGLEERPGLPVLVYREIKALAQRYGISIAKKSPFDDYLDYLQLSESFDAVLFAAAVRDLENALYARLIRTEKERGLIQQSRLLQLQKKLVDFSLTPDEWVEYKKIKPQKEKNNTFGNLKFAWNLEIDAWDFSSFEEFYELADQRSVVMARKTADRMAEGGFENAVLIAGGFHTQILKETLEARGVAVRVISPKITRVETPNGAAYLSVFSREKTPLENLLAGDKLFLPRNPGFGVPKIHPLLTLQEQAADEPAQTDISGIFGRTMDKSQAEVTMTVDPKRKIGRYPAIIKVTSRAVTTVFSRFQKRWREITHSPWIERWNILLFRYAVTEHEPANDFEYWTLVGNYITLWGLISGFAALAAAPLAIVFHLPFALTFFALLIPSAAVGVFPSHHLVNAADVALGLRSLTHPRTFKFAPFEADDGRRLFNKGESELLALLSNRPATVASFLKKVNVAGIKNQEDFNAAFTALERFYGRNDFAAPTLTFIRTLYQAGWPPSGILHAVPPPYETIFRDYFTLELMEKKTEASPERLQASMERIIRITFDYFIFYHTQLLAARAWENPRRFRPRVKKLLKKLHESPGASGQVFTGQTTSLEIFLTSFITSIEKPYLPTEQQLIAADKSFARNSALNTARHLYFVTGRKWRAPAKNLNGYRKRNSLDYVTLTLDLIAMLEEYESVKRNSPGSKAREESAQALFLTLACDPRALMTRDLLMGIKNLKTDFENNHPQIYPNDLPNGVIDRYFQLLEANKTDLADDVERMSWLKPEPGRYNPFALRVVFSAELMHLHVLHSLINPGNEDIDYDSYVQPEKKAGRRYAHAKSLSELAVRMTEAKLRERNIPFGHPYDDEAAALIYDEALRTLRGQPELPLPLTDRYHWKLEWALKKPWGTLPEPLKRYFERTGIPEEFLELADSQKNLGRSTDSLLLFSTIVQLCDGHIDQHATLLCRLIILGEFASNARIFLYLRSLKKWLPYADFQFLLERLPMINRLNTDEAQDLISTLFDLTSMYRADSKFNFHDALTLVLDFKNRGQGFSWELSQLIRIASDRKMNWEDFFSLTRGAPELDFFISASVERTEIPVAQEWRGWEIFQKSKFFTNAAHVPAGMKMAAEAGFAILEAVVSNRFAFNEKLEQAISLLPEPMQSYWRSRIPLLISETLEHGGPAGFMKFVNGSLNDWFRSQGHALYFSVLHENGVIGVDQLLLGQFLLRRGPYPILGREFFADLITPPFNGAVVNLNHFGLHSSETGVNLVYPAHIAVQMIARMETRQPAFYRLLRKTHLPHQLLEMFVEDIVIEELAHARHRQWLLVNGYLEGREAGSYSDVLLDNLIHHGSEVWDLAHKTLSSAALSPLVVETAVDELGAHLTRIVTGADPFTTLEDWFRFVTRSKAPPTHHLAGHWGLYHLARNLKILPRLRKTAVSRPGWRKIREGFISIPRRDIRREAKKFHSASFRHKIDEAPFAQFDEETGGLNFQSDLSRTGLPVLTGPLAPSSFPFLALQFFFPEQAKKTWAKLIFGLGGAVLEGYLIFLFLTGEAPAPVLTLKVAALLVFFWFYAKAHALLVPGSTTWSHYKIFLLYLPFVFAGLFLLPLTIHLFSDINRLWPLPSFDPQYAVLGVVLASSLQRDEPDDESWPFIHINKRLTRAENYLMVGYRYAQFKKELKDVFLAVFKKYSEGPQTPPGLETAFVTAAEEIKKAQKNVRTVLQEFLVLSNLPQARDHFAGLALEGTVDCGLCVVTAEMIQAAAHQLNLDGHWKMEIKRRKNNSGGVRHAYIEITFDSQRLAIDAAAGQLTLDPHFHVIIDDAATYLDFVDETIFEQTNPAGRNHQSHKQKITAAKNLFDGYRSLLFHLPRKPATHALPRYLQDSFIAELENASINGRASPALLKRVRRHGLAWLHRGNVFIEEDALPFFKKVLEEKLKRSFSIEQIGLYLTEHELIHRRIFNAHKNHPEFIIDLFEKLQDADLYRDTPLGGYPDFKKAFAANYGPKFLSDAEFLDELLAVYATEWSFFEQPVRVLVPGPADPRLSRMDIPPAIDEILFRLSEKLDLLKDLRDKIPQSLGARPNYFEDLESQVRSATVPVEAETVPLENLLAPATYTYWQRLTGALDERVRQGAMNFMNFLSAPRVFLIQLMASWNGDDSVVSKGVSTRSQDRIVAHNRNVLAGPFRIKGGASGRDWPFILKSNGILANALLFGMDGVNPRLEVQNGLAAAHLIEAVHGNETLPDVAIPVLLKKFKLIPFQGRMYSVPDYFRLLIQTVPDQKENMRNIVDDQRKKRNLPKLSEKPTDGLDEKEWEIYFKVFLEFIWPHQMIDVNQGSIRIAFLHVLRKPGMLENYFKRIGMGESSDLHRHDAGRRLIDAILLRLFRHYRKPDGVPSSGLSVEDNLRLYMTDALALNKNEAKNLLIGVARSLGRSFGTLWGVGGSSEGEASAPRNIGVGFDFLENRYKGVFGDFDKGTFPSPLVQRFTDNDFILGLRMDTFNAYKNIYFLAKFLDLEAGDIEKAVLQLRSETLSSLKKTKEKILFNPRQENLQPSYLEEFKSWMARPELAILPEHPLPKGLQTPPLFYEVIRELKSDSGKTAQAGLHPVASFMLPVLSPANGEASSAWSLFIIGLIFYAGFYFYNAYIKNKKNPAGYKSDLADKFAPVTRLDVGRRWARPVVTLPQTHPIPSLRRLRAASESS